MKKPPPINALGTVEFFTLTGDDVTQVKIKLSSDIPSNVSPAIREHIANVQFGVFYTFMTDERALADTGKVFRAGLSFGQRSQSGNDGWGPNDGPPEPRPPTDDDEIMRPIKDLEKSLKDDDNA